MSFNPHEFTVTRQSQWSTGDQVVEVSQGDINYSNPDMLCRKYKGEGETFEGMHDAVLTAIKIVKSWKKDEPTKKILIAIGNTGGDTMPFEGEKLTKKLEKALIEKAIKFDEELPKCDQCGAILGKERWKPLDYDDCQCCSEYCADKLWSLYEEESARLNAEEAEEAEAAC